MTTSGICASSCRCGSESGLLTRVEFSSFRNLTDARWAPGPGSHLLVGPNGAGKTSLLEAVYLLATTRSFRTPRLAECCRMGSDNLAVTGRIAGDAGDDLELAWSASGGPSRRRNGNSVSVAEYLGVFSVVCWSAEQLRILDGGPRHRRRLLDQGAVGRRPALVTTLSQYRRALEHKRRLLKEGGRGLAAWNRVLAESAAAIAAQRSEFVHELEQGLVSMAGRLALEVPPLTLRYRPSPPLSRPTVDELAARFDADAGRELETGRIVSGPHRDEMELLWGGTEVATASAGEKKLFGLLLSLARIEVLHGAGRRPTLLLDDIDAELDYRRLELVWSVARGQVAQTILATSHEAALGCLPGARIWDVTSGRIEPRDGFFNGSSGSV